MLAAAFAVVAAVPALRPAVASAAGIKVVVIVGPVEGLTSTYRSYAEKVAQTAASYGADVRRVYSPNATWKNVLANIQGASVVVYMGHGNGYPNPYVSFLQPNVNDGFGLNDPNNLDDNHHIYYGESYLAQYVKLAPNAVVFLSHACYAPGASESWDKDPTVSVARQRADNFAAGFIAAGARAVFALSHADPSPYLAQLFTTDSSMKSIFETASDWDGRWVQSFASVRSSGFDAELDPTLDQRLSPPQPTYYLRSLVTWPGLTASQVTSFDPDAPRLTAFSPQTAYLSPNGDGLKDMTTFAGTWSAPTNWRLQVQAQDGTTLSETTGTGTALSATWTGDDMTAASVDGSPVLVSDGLYRVVVDATDDAGHVSVPLNYAATVDTVSPTNSAPSSYLYSGTRLGSSTTPVRTSWSGSDAGGIASYSLRRQVIGGGYYSVSLPSPTSTYVYQSSSFGSAYRYRLNATDRAANHDGWVYGPTFKPLLTQQSSSAVSYSGKWYSLSNSYASGGSFRYASAAGASASYTFTGSSIGWAAFKCPSCGSAKVYLDGVYRTTVSLYSSSYSYRPIVYAAHWSANGSHTIRIVVIGTAGHPRVYVDAFVRLYRL